MKTTVKTAEGQVVAMPYEYAMDPAIYLSINRGQGRSESMSLTPDEAGALIFGLEQALESIDIKHRRTLDAFRAKDAGGVRCHGYMCAAGQLACPTPKACGVAA